MDIILPLLKEAQKAREKTGRKLKIVLTSANPDKDKLIDYFEDGCAHIKVPGRAFHVDEEFAAADTDPDQAVENAVKKAKELITKNTKKETGDILIFMPGKFEIDQTIEEIKKAVGERDDLIYIPLLGGDQKDESENIYQDTPGKRKIIVSTNVAETSITIESVKSVIDSGLMRTTIFDEASGITELRTIEHTQSNALQRKGRAGRVDKGKVYYLFSKKQMEERPKQIQPEILRTNLISQILLLKGLGFEDVNIFDFIDHPGKEKIDQALYTLFILGALNEKKEITELGKQMMEEETDPHFARMLIEARRRNCEEAVELLIGVMSERSSIYTRNDRPFKISGSDFLSHLAVWNEYAKNDTDEDSRNTWSEKYGINTKPLYFGFKNARDLFHGKLHKKSLINLSEEAREAISISIASGLIDRHLIKESENSYNLAETNRRNIQIDNRSVLAGTGPDHFFSANLRYAEKIDKTFAGFNMVLNEKILKEAAPYLFPELKNDKKEELSKPAEKPAESPKSIPNTTEVYTPASPPKFTESFDEIKPHRSPTHEEKKIPKNLFQKIKEIAGHFKQSVASVWRKIKELFFE